MAQRLLLKASLFSMQCGIQKGLLRRVSLQGSAVERSRAISRVISPRGGAGPELLPTCASGFRNQDRTGIDGIPLLCPEVFDLIATHLEPIYGIETCIAWGHLLGSGDTI